jgi:nicotinamide riboside kinase
MWPEPPPGHGARLIAVVGAESTGKSTLAQALADAVPAVSGLSCTWVPEALRDWCTTQGRTPQAHEQADIAAEQARRIAQAATEQQVVICDTTPLMTAAYHHHVFGSDALDAQALRWQGHCAHTLLMALDLPWQSDGFMRDGATAQAPVDARLRQLLIAADLPFTVVRGRQADRLQAALDALSPVLRDRALRGSGLFTRLAERDAAQPDWRWTCDCDAPECEHLLKRARRTASR